ncbi:hypothetical protein F4776DRAFT_659930 [Hypoxylon sp. NC0597]|nr:hypothetical protein F4776DRAFT_659930 [Hypoxylon sp. NC0597]
MRYQIIPKAFFLSPFTLPIKAFNTNRRTRMAGQGAFKCLINEDSHSQVGVTGFTFGQLDVLPGDIDTPPRPSSATVSFTVSNAAHWQQACSGSIIQLQDGERQDADGLAWFKCGTEPRAGPHVLELHALPVRLGPRELAARREPDLTVWRMRLAIFIGSQDRQH